MRVFLDTNVLFSGLLSFLGPPSRIIDAATRAETEVQFVVSVDVLAELTRNIRRKAPQLLPDLNRFLTSARLEFVNPPEEEIQRWLAEFGSDAPVIAGAVAGRVDHLCTGDKRLLAHGRTGALGDLRVLSPSELVRLLQ
ncbi:MAG: putative toxin-antitoxin system toxin component, PIN family [Chloroflexi bacterium RBG_16_68_14]|nr:MAG: putative toxin-antitoxin system toxin component, PIN family [Chloroflexi bacterium RBG_16_68_14]